MCLNWKVIAALAAVGVGTYAFAPGLAAAALPILILAVCPISMMLMMWSMQGGGGGEQAKEETSLTSEERISRLRARQADLDGEIEALERAGSRPGGDKE
ncbi:MAG: DUF2933 domain-containing protein [Gemmatimonadetes bacterium]|nr:DUF2933 domain-containing protein [Gemmatimonadota bacterium]